MVSLIFFHASGIITLITLEFLNVSCGNGDFKIEVASHSVFIHYFYCYFGKIEYRIKRLKLLIITRFNIQDQILKFSKYIIGGDFDFVARLKKLL